MCAATLKRSKDGNYKLEVGPKTLMDVKKKANENSAERSSADATSTRVGESKR